MEIVGVNSQQLGGFGIASLGLLYRVDDEASFSVH